MTAIHIEHLREWVGKTQTDTDIVSSRQTRLMAATLDVPQSELSSGTPLPPLWHWLYFLTGENSSALGRDGHPARGGFLPPVSLPNRMWAGGQLEFHETVPLDTRVQKRSTVVSVDHKEGRSGELVFVRVKHEIINDGSLAISELQDIVYMGAMKAGSQTDNEPMPTPDSTRTTTPTSTTLFRYSALTFNGHRIHYDVDYCRDVEGYPNLVIHGPLNATLLAGFACEIGGGRLRQFSFRGVKPSLLGAELTLNAKWMGDQLILWVGLPDGTISMRAEARF